MTDITVIGLGKMGSALAACFLQSGRSVTVWNRSEGKADALLPLGGVPAVSLEQAIRSSPVIVTCLRNHATTSELLSPQAAALSGKTVIDLSTGDAEEAQDLVAMLTAAGADWQIGMINAYPSGIGQAETAILCGGPEAVWERCEDVIRILGGASAHVGTQAAAIPALFAAMFTARQGFMFGLIYGGALCRKAGLPMQVFADQFPVTLNMAGNYAQLFADTVPDEAYDNASATMLVYLNALQDVMATFGATGTPDALPRLMRDLSDRAVQEGLGEQELTALVEMLANDQKP